MQQLVGLDDNDATPLAHSIFPRRINASGVPGGTAAGIAIRNARLYGNMPLRSDRCDN
jgi:hypothetical protein